MPAETKAEPAEQALKPLGTYISREAHEKLQRLQTTMAARQRPVRVRKLSQGEVLTSLILAADETTL
ncbi:MAG TPA: hypothetical protein VFI02_17515 [Armatimonadota bacterium]|nr:hypothetical protein [Armatimonadota bacterium]